MKIESASVSIPVEAQEPESQGKVEKVGGKRFGYNYIFIKSYKESKKNDVVKCLYIKSLTNFGFCVIKEGCYGDTKDKQGRDIIDRLKWQKELHEKLQGKVPIPRLLGQFSERGNYYLVIEHIKGEPLQKLCGKHRKELRQSLINGDKLGMQFLDYLIQIAGILETLHAHDIVHRDATPNNYMITKGGKVALIDMEMCYSVAQQFPTPAFALGTYGYMSPQQEKIQVPTKAEDIFALGAIILQMWSGVSPGKLTNEPIEVLTSKIRFFIPDQAVADLVTQCLQPADDQRPTASVIKEVLQAYKADLWDQKARPVYETKPFTREDILATVQEAIYTLASPLLADPEKGWFADDMKAPAEEEKHKLRKQYYASYNRGASGVIYFLSQAKKAGLDVTPTLPYVQKGLELIKEKYIDRIERKSPGLHFGSDGIAMTLAAAIQSGLIEPTTEQVEWIGQLLENSAESINITNGVAGQGLANLACRAFINPITLQERLERYAQLITDKQEVDGSWTHGFIKQKFSRKKKKKVIRGFTEGMAGIIYFLLALEQYYKNAKVIGNVTKEALQWLMKKAVRKNGIVYWRTAKGKEMNYGWAEGITGIALTFIKAYEVTGEAIYKQYAIGTLHSVSPFITDTNISLTQGLSGLGEVYLEAYRIFKEEEWLDRVNWIASVITQLTKQYTQYGSYWVVEHERQPVANLMVGNSGVLHFLLRNCCPTKIELPSGG